MLKVVLTFSVKISKLLRLCKFLTDMALEKKESEAAADFSLHPFLGSEGKYEFKYS